MEVSGGVEAAGSWSVPAGGPDSDWGYGMSIKGVASAEIQWAVMVASKASLHLV